MNHLTTTKWWLCVAGWTSLCLVIFLTGCASTEPRTVVKTRTLTIEKEVLLPVPEELTEQVEVPLLPVNADTLQVGAVYRATVIRLMVANGKLKAIEELSNPPEMEE